MTRTLAIALALPALLFTLSCGAGASGPAKPATSPAAAGARPAGAAKLAASPAPSAPAGAPAAPASGPGSAAAPAASPAPVPAGLESLPPRAQRLFGEAVATEEDLKKQKLPPDWPLLERRWRAVLEAAELPEAHYNLGVTLEAEGRLEEARAEYERARAAKPGLRQAAVNLGVLQEKSGDLTGAQLTYAAVVRDFPEDARARERLAALYLGSGQLDEASRMARDALLRDPRSVAANKVLIGVAAQKKEIDLAKLIALRTAKLAPDDPELPYLSGELSMREGDEVGAEAHFKKALSQDPHYLPARSALLRTAMRRGNWAAVEEQSAGLAKDEPKDPTVQLALGVALRHGGKLDEALSAYGRAEQLSGGKLAEVYLARGLLYMREKNQCGPALEDFRRYGQVAGPVATTESPVLKLQRECEAIEDENRKAQQAASEMQRDAALKGGGKAKGAEPAKAVETADPLALPAPSEEGAAPPTPPPIEVQ